MMIHIDEQEIQKWKNAYTDDPHFHLVLESEKAGKKTGLAFSQYHHSGNSLIYFEDSVGNMRLCVPKSCMLK